MIVLGVNSAFHESSAALVCDGRVVAAAEEERFSRCKHGKPARVDNAHQLPVDAIRYCLGAGGIRRGTSMPWPTRSIRRCARRRSSATR